MNLTYEQKLKLINIQQNLHHKNNFNKKAIEIADSLELLADHIDELSKTARELVDIILGHKYIKD